MAAASSDLDSDSEMDYGDGSCFLNEVDNPVSSNPENDAESNFNDEDLLEISVEEFGQPVNEITFEISVENLNCEVPPTKKSNMEENTLSWETPPLEEKTLSWETPPVEKGDDEEAEASVNIDREAEASVNIDIDDEAYVNIDIDAEASLNNDIDAEVRNAEDGVDSDGENPAERFDYEIAMATGEFEEDPEVRHDVIYESEEDSQEERAARKERSRNFTPRYDGILFKGQKVLCGIAFKEGVLHHALKNQRDIRQVRYDKKKLGFSCLGTGKNGNRCKWRVYCSIRKGSTSRRIRKVGPDHTCEKSGDCALLKVTAIARLFHDKIRDEPEYFMPMKIEELIYERWGISVTRNQTQAARGKALKWIEAEYDDQFRRLRDYGNEIKHSNPGSSVEVKCLKNSEGQDVFSRFYVCFGALRRCWKGTCWPLIGIDGTFLKSKVKGQLLVALGRDGNNKIYPVAWGVVEKEDSLNWVWFMKKVKEDLVLGDGSGFVIVSDRQKGLISAVKAQLPGAEHRHCVRHIYGNMKAKFGKKDPMKKFVWDLAWSYNEVEFKENLEDIKNFDSEVYKYVINSNPSSWCRAFYRLGPCVEDVENNSVESFNRTVAKARERPFVPMLEMIRTQAMNRISKRHEETKTYEGVLTPYAEEEDLAKKCKIKASTGGMYQASLSGQTYCVNLIQKTCTCRKWQIKGIPCEHAYGVILKRKLRVQDYVNTWFHAETWRRTYEEGITVPRGSRFWPRGSYLPIQYPPETEKMGCKEKKRKRGKNESPTKKKDNDEKRVMHCKICGKAGHNSRFHKDDKDGKQKKAKVTGKVGKGEDNVKVDKETDKQKRRKGQKVEKNDKKVKGNEQKGKGKEKKSKGNGKKGKGNVKKGKGK